MAALGVDPRITVALASALLFTVVIVATPRIGEGSAAEGEDAPRFRLPSRAVLLLAILCLLVMVTEGAMSDWGGIYLRELGSSAAVAALAFAVFSAGMTTGRVFGDWFTGRLGPVSALRWGALLTGVPLAAFLLIGQPAVALLGLFVVGLGVANGVPLMFSAAGRQPDVASGPGIAAVVLDGLVRLPDRPADHRLPRRRRLAGVGARHADPRRGRGVRAGAPRRRSDRAPDLRRRHLRPRRRADRLVARRPCAAGARGASATASTARRSRPATTADPRVP